MLVQERDGLDQGQVLLLVAPGSHRLVRKGQARRVRAAHGDRPQQALGVLVQLADLRAPLAPDRALSRARQPLRLVNGDGLLPGLVHREHDAPVLQLLVEVDGGGGQEDRRRAFDVVLVGHQLARGRVLAGRGDGELALALQQLEGVAGALCPLLLGDRQDLVLEVGLSHVEEALPGHRRVLDPLLFRHEGQHRLHQRRLAGRRARLHQHPERLVELARDRRQVADELVGVLADQAAGLEVGRDPVQEPRVLQEGQGLGALCVVEVDGLVLGLERPADLPLLQLLEPQEHVAQVALDDALLDRQLERGLAREDAPLARGVEVEAVDVHALAGTDHQVHLEHVVGHVLAQAAHPVDPVAYVQVDAGGLDLGGDVDARRRWKRRGRFRGPGSGSRGPISRWSRGRGGSCLLGFDKGLGIRDSD